MGCVEWVNGADVYLQNLKKKQPVFKWMEMVKEQFPI